MAYFAQIENDLVTQVIAVNDAEVPNEAAGIAFLTSIGLTGQWVQTGFDGEPIDGQDRGPFAGRGYTWDGTVFTPPTIEETP